MKQRIILAFMAVVLVAPYGYTAIGDPPPAREPYGISTDRDFQNGIFKDLPIPDPTKLTEFFDDFHSFNITDVTNDLMDFSEGAAIPVGGIVSETYDGTYIILVTRTAGFDNTFGEVLGITNGIGGWLGISPGHTTTATECSVVIQATPSFRFQPGSETWFRARFQVEEPTNASIFAGLAGLGNSVTPTIFNLGILGNPGVMFTINGSPNGGAAFPGANLGGLFTVGNVNLVISPQGGVTAGGPYIGCVTIHDITTAYSTNMLNMADSTTDVGLHYDGVSELKYYLDGAHIGTASTASMPTQTMGVAFGVINHSTLDAENSVRLDYLFAAQER